MRRTKILLITLLLALAGLPCEAQSRFAYQPDASRILFILDASGSMLNAFGGQTKYAIAQKVINHITDSVMKANPKVEFALRVLGHQYPDAAHNCTDTKLEVPFSRNDAAQVAAALSRITPQGNTPLAYTLFQALGDFPADTLSTNAIVLITDGVETCEGNLCALQDALAKKRIAMRPFIVGMGLNPDTGMAYFKCIGTFYNTYNEASMNHVVNAVVSQALNTTSVQVNLLSAYGQPTESNVEMSFYDHGTGKLRYQFVHTLTAAGIPDTLYLDPVGHYDLVIHTIPEVKKEDIELVPGKHNQVAVEVPRGNLSLEMDNVSSGYSAVQCLVREAGSDAILNVQDFKTSTAYLVGHYDLEILTTPRILMQDVEIEQSRTKSIKIPMAGTLQIVPSQASSASVLTNSEEMTHKVWDFYSVSTPESVELQPGNYQLVFRPDKGKQAGNTRVIPFTVTSGKTTAIKI